jgi:hypothetical protein
MATIQTGRTLDVTIDSVDYSAQVAEVTLVPNETVDQYVTLTDTTAVRQPTTWTLNVRAFQDWGAAGSFCDAMWTAAAAGTAVSFSLGLDGSGTLSGDIIPVYPTAGGPADGALEVSYTFEVDGSVTKA